MTMIEAPVEFRAALRNLAGTSFEDAIADEGVGLIGYLAYYFLMGSTARERDVMRQFLDALLSQGLDDATLAEFWRSLGSDLHIPDGRGVRALLWAIRAELGPRSAAYGCSSTRAPRRSERAAALA